MTKELLPLCSVQKITTRDGYVGALGRIFLPFFGYWFASGQQISVDNTFANLAQDNSYTMQGQVKTNTFSKDGHPGQGDGTGL